VLFHVPSFALGYVAGLGTGLALPRLRPVAVEIVTAVHRFVDDVAGRIATVREGLEDVVAEARERVRRPPPSVVVEPPPTPHASA
jgi:hypothetical protein